MNTSHGISRLANEGWLLIEGVLSAKEIAAMHTAWDEFEVSENQTWDVAGKCEFLPCIESPILFEFLPALLGDAIKLESLKGRSPKPDYGPQGLHVDTVGPVKPGEQILANAFWILDEMSRENGATRLVPDSHKTYSVPAGNYAQPNGKHPNEIYISANPGDLLLFSAHLWHSGSRNESGTRRRVVIAQFRRRK